MGKGKTATTTKSKRAHSRAGLHFPVTRTTHHLREQLKGVRLDGKLRISITAIGESALNAFIVECKKKMSDKDKTKGMIRANHCAEALADTTTEFYGVFPTRVAGIHFTKN